MIFSFAFLNRSWYVVESLRHVFRQLTHLGAERRVPAAFLFTRGYRTSHEKLQL
jgi:hypothetical protein